jgi:hypothetical protein
MRMRRGCLWGPSWSRTSAHHCTPMRCAVIGRLGTRIEAHLVTGEADGPAVVLFCAHPRYTTCARDDFKDLALPTEAKLGLREAAMMKKLW